MKDFNQMTQDLQYLVGRRIISIEHGGIVPFGTEEVLSALAIRFDGGFGITLEEKELHCMSFPITDVPGFLKESSS